MNAEAGVAYTSGISFKLLLPFKLLQELRENPKKILFTARVKFVNAIWCIMCIWRPSIGFVFNLKKEKSQGFRSQATHVISYRLSVENLTREGICQIEIEDEEFAGNCGSPNYLVLTQTQLEEQRDKIARNGELTLSLMATWAPPAEVLQQPTFLPEEPQQGSSSVLTEAEERNRNLPWERPNNTVPQSSSLDHLSRDLQKLFREGKNCDFTIKVGGEKFPVHWAIINARSSILTEMDGNEKEISNVEPDLFRPLLMYVYCGHIKLSNTNVFKFYHLAEHYNIRGLKEECDAFIRSCTSIDLLCDSVAFADRINAMQITPEAISYIRNKTNNS